MLTRQQKEQYYRDGYLLVKNVLSADEVAWLRAFFRPKFDSPHLLADTHHWLLDIFGRYAEVRWLCFHEPTLQIVRSLFGEDVLLLPESTAHFNYFGGWHKDTGTFDRAGRAFFKEQGYEMWTVGYYLQDNTVEYGGGLDVEPGTHREPEDLIIRPPAFRERGLAKKIWHQIYPPARRRYWRRWEEFDKYGYQPKNVVSIPSLAGDAVLFDSRVNHHATPPSGIVPDGAFVRRGALPVEHEKISIFSAWSRNHPTARAYLDWNKTRKEYPHLQNFSYPADFLIGAEKAGVKLIY